MSSRRWFNPGQPQTLQIAVFLLYANAGLALLHLNDQRGIYQLAVQSVTRSQASDFPIQAGNVLWAVLVFGAAFCAYGIANEKKVAWRAAVGIAIAPLAARVILMFIGYPQRIGLFHFDLIGLVFDVALVALLVHPQSKDYERLWFR